MGGVRAILPLPRSDQLDRPQVHLVVAELEDALVVDDALVPLEAADRRRW